MKKWLLVAMLVIMGERWELSGQSIWDTCKPTTDGTGIQCTGNPNMYERVYVIGERTPWRVCGGSGDCADYVEKFTIPVPHVPTKAMTKEEAAKANKELHENFKN